MTAEQESILEEPHGRLLHEVSNNARDERCRTGNHEKWSPGDEGQVRHMQHDAIQDRQSLLKRASGSESIKGVASA